MKKLTLLFAILASVACQKEEVSEDVQLSNNIEIIDDWHLSNEKAPENFGATSRYYIPENILNIAESTTTWNTPWWIQTQLGGYGLHYGNNPYRLDASLDPSNWLRGRAWLFTSKLGVKFVVMRRNSEWIMITKSETRLNSDTYFLKTAPIDADLLDFITKTTNTITIRVETGVIACLQGIVPQTTTVSYTENSYHDSGFRGSYRPREEEFTVFGFSGTGDIGIWLESPGCAFYDFYRINIDGPGSYTFALTGHPVPADGNYYPPFRENNGHYTVEWRKDGSVLDVDLNHSYHIYWPFEY